MKSSLPFVGIIHPQNPVEIHRAGWVVCSSGHILENGFVTVENGRVTGVSAGARTIPASGTVIDHGPGVLMPGLVNAHVHLELCALHGKVSYDQGFGPWVRELLAQRESMGNERLSLEASQGLEQLRVAGVLRVGEVSTLGITRTLFNDGAMQGVWFQERLGPMTDAADPVDRTGTGPWFSLAGHAPHTSDPELLQSLKQKTLDNGLPFSIHVAESSEETAFITTGRGEWADFLEERGIDFSTWPVPEKSPVAYLNRLGLLDSSTTAVHLLDVDADDLELLSETGTRVIVCPRSNRNLHGRLPDIEAFLSMGLKPALGTDSLASNDSLSIFDEMAFVLRHFSRVAPRDILAMATEYGARALGMEAMAGTIGPGKTARFLYLPIQATGSDALIERITAYHDI